MGIQPFGKHNGDNNMFKNKNKKPTWEVLELATDSAALTAFRPNPPNGCPKEGGFKDENGAD